MENSLVAGLDEVGMGCVAGPLVVVVAAFPEDTVRIAGVKDSKRCTKENMRKLAPEIVKAASFIGIGFTSARTIETVKIAESWQLAAMMALEGAPQFKELIVDGNRMVDDYIGRQRVLPKADALHWEVSAASIVAKVLRDLEMTELAETYPHYGWVTNAGYGTPEHLEGLRAHGMTPFHRTSFTEKLMSH